MQHALRRVRRVIGLSAAGFALVVVALTWALVERSEQLAIRSGQEQVARVVSATETALNRNLVSLDIFLAEVARWIPPPPSGPQATQDSLMLFLRATLNQNLMLRDVAVLDAQGQVQVSARPATGRLGLEMPAGFLASVLAQPYPAMAISPPIAHSKSAERVIYLARSAHPPGGPVLAVVAEVHVPLLAALLDPGDPTDQMAVTLERGTGELLASHPEFDALSGRRLHPGLDAMPSDGTAREADGRLSPSTSLLAVRPTLYPGLFISAGLQRDGVLAEWRDDRNVILGISGTLLVLTALAAAGAWRHMHRITLARNEVAQANTRLLQTNADLERSLGLVQATLESTADAILVVDLEGHIKQYNAQFVKYTGIPEALLASDRLEAGREHLYGLLVHPETAFELAERAYRHPTVETRDLVEFKNGRVFMRHSTPQIVAGQPVGRVWCYQDITAFKHAESELRAQQAAASQAHADLAATLGAIPDLLFELDEQGRCLDVRAGQRALLPAPPEKLLGRTVQDTLPGPASAEVAAALEEAAAHGFSYGRQIELALDDGQRWYEISVARKATAAPGCVRFVLIARDITHRKQAEEELHMAALVYRSSSEGMAVTDADGHVITINPAFTHITGYTLEEVLGNRLSLLNSGRQSPEFYNDLWHQLDTRGQWQGELWNRRKNGELYAEALTINTIFRPDGSPHQRIALFSDITQRKTHEELIWSQANFDALTGLPNRRMFREHLAHAIRKADAGQHRLALMFLDLDRFKEINDTHGHDMGDLLLQTAAQRLRSCVRETDMVARLGGDEFTLVVSDVDHTEQARHIAHTLLQRLAEPFHLGKEIEYLSASVGITLFPDDGQDSETLVKQADQAMYAAKRLGRNRCEHFTPAMQEAALVRSRIARDLRGALQDQQFWLAYQPIVDLRTGAIRKAEALLRWQHPIQGLISPATFIPIAEEAGSIHDIGRWVFETAAAQVAVWQHTLDPEFQISVNKSPVQFREGSHKSQSWTSHLAGLGLAGRSVVLEITEGLLMEATEATREHLAQLHEAGVQIALDDFGTGYSALSYLHRFELDYLKIDQSFVRHLEPGSKDLALCKATIVMAHELGLKVVAEGIETPEQRRLLTDAGCDYGQGYLFSRPVPAEAFEALIRAHNAGT